jgi:hypothetical protein
LNEFVAGVEALMIQSFPKSPISEHAALGIKLSTHVLSEDISDPNRNRTQHYINNKLKTASLNLLIPQICVQYAKYIDRENKKR